MDMYVIDEAANDVIFDANLPSFLYTSKLVGESTAGEVAVAGVDRDSSLDEEG